jgi:hypothetical protein
VNNKKEFRGEEKMLKENKKGLQLAQVPGVVVILVVVAIILSIGSTIVQDVRDDQTESNAAWNASNNGLLGIAKVASWQKTIGTVIGAAVVIGLVVGAFMFLSKR